MTPGTRATPGTRQRILDAALACFDERGVGAPSLEEIRLRAGVSTGSLYHHFPGGRDGIVAQLHLQAVRQFQEAMLAELAGSGDVVRAVARQQVLWVAGHRDLGALLVGRAPGARERSDPELAALNEAFFGAVGAWLEAAMAEGRVRAVPVPVAIALWLGPGVLLARQYLAGELPDDIEPVVEAAADAVCAALRATPAVAD